MKTANPFWIKQRNAPPQLGTYFVKCGQMSRKDARARTSSLYGSNVMLEFADEASYNAKLNELKASGERIQ